MQRIRVTPLKFVLFLLITAALIIYAAAHWDAFQEQTAAPPTERSVQTPPREASVQAPSGDSQTEQAALPWQKETSSKRPEPEPDLFIEERLKQQRNLSEERQALAEVMASVSEESPLYDDAQQRWLALSKQYYQGQKLESLLRANGFSDALVFVNENGATVVVEAASLEREQVAQVAELAEQVTGFGPEQLMITASE